MWKLWFYCHLFPCILFPTLLPDLYFLLSTLNISLSCDTTMTKRTLKWSGHANREGGFQMSVSQGMRYKMPLGRQRSSFGRFPILIHTARELCDSGTLRQGKHFFSLVIIIQCLLHVSRGISIPCCAQFCISNHSATPHISNSFPVTLSNMAATPFCEALHRYIVLEHLI